MRAQAWARGIARRFGTSPDPPRPPPPFPTPLCGPCRDFGGLSLRVPTMKSWGYFCRQRARKAFLTAHLGLSRSGMPYGNRLPASFSEGKMNSSPRSVNRKFGGQLDDESGGSFAIDCPPCCSADVSRHGERLIRSELPALSRSFGRTWFLSKGRQLPFRVRSFVQLGDWPARTGVTAV